jgi:DNA-binding GntR family transcriptional regulator
MVRHVSASSIAGRSSVGRATVALALAAALGGCGSSSSGNPSASATIAADAHMTCPQAVVDTLTRVVKHVYHEGVSSERTVTAQHTIAASTELRAAVQANDPLAATAAARALVASGRMTSLLVMRGSKTLANVGEPALAPLRGTIIGAAGGQIATYVTSVWSDSGFIAESDGIGEGLLALRERGRSVGGSLALAPGRLPKAGTLTYQHAVYQYSSFGAHAFPSGSLRVYLLKPLSSTSAFCGASSEDAIVNTLSRVASQIYAAEGGGRTAPQVRRVQADQGLLSAVARRDPIAAKAAVERLLNQHIVRLRVNAGGRLLTDVGGPYVLAPVRAPLVLGGRTIGSFVLSIQDDEGYLRLTRRLAGLYVLMYMNGGQLVKNSLGPEPGTVPERGSYTYRGRSFRVFTLHARAFPSGPLLVNVLIPVPYT